MKKFAQDHLLNFSTLRDVTSTRLDLLSNLQELGFVEVVSSDLGSKMSPESRPFAALSPLGEFSPMAKAMASARFDLPLPLGPVMKVKPRSKLTAVVRGPEDLNPRISSLRIYVTA